MIPVWQAYPYLLVGSGLLVVGAQEFSERIGRLLQARVTRQLGVGTKLRFRRVERGAPEPRIYFKTAKPRRVGL